MNIMDRSNPNYNQTQNQDRRDLQMQYRNLPGQTAFPGRPVIPGQQANFPVQTYQQQQTVYNTQHPQPLTQQISQQISQQMYYQPTPPVYSVQPIYPAQQPTYNLQPTVPQIRTEER